MNESDTIDWKESRAGDQTSFGSLHRRHRGRIYSFCLYVSGDAELSADICQESFLRLIQQQSCPENIRNWLFITARNLLYTALKRKRREYNTVSEFGLPSIYAATQEQELLIEQLLNRLTIEERELILLRDYAGFTANELAETLAVSPEVIRVRLFRIRKKLQSTFEDKE